MSKSSRDHARVSPLNKRDMQRSNREASIGARITPQPDGCWLFKGTTNPYGYGVATLEGGRNQLAHRYVYETLIGDLDDDVVLHHKCEVKTCVNPEHLTPMSRADHMAEHHRLRAADVA